MSLARSPSHSDSHCLTPAHPSIVCLIRNLFAALLLCLISLADQYVKYWAAEKAQQLGIRSVLA